MPDTVVLNVTYTFTTSFKATNLNSYCSTFLDF